MDFGKIGMNTYAENADAGFYFFIGVLLKRDLLFAGYLCERN